MFPIFRSIIGLLTGLALSIYGISHVLLHYPGPEPFAALVSNLSALSAVLMFALGLMAALTGMAMLLGSGRRLGRQWRQLKYLTGRRRDLGYDEDLGMADGAWAGSHR